MYATGPMTSGCDMTLVNSVTVASPLYVEGNLCMTNTATITKGPLVVKGQLSVTKSQNYVGHERHADQRRAHRQPLLLLERDADDVHE